MGTNIENIKSNISLENITFLKCSEVDIDFVYRAFTIGFSDYIVKLEMPKEVFIHNFFGPEGNDLEISYIALHENEPVGLVLSGIKNYENMKTIRCGTLTIHPEYRGTGISQKLMELHKEEALRFNCKQMFLEVIVGNDRAINFYKKLGYEKVYDISYFTKKDLSVFKNSAPNSDCTVSKISFEQFKEKAQKWDYHINWQNDVEFLEKSPNTVYFGAFICGEFVGATAVNPNGKISFIMVDQTYRRKKIAHALLFNASKELDLHAFSAGFPNNNKVEGFFNSLGFNKEKLSQYEMYLPLSK